MSPTVTPFEHTTSDGYLGVDESNGIQHSMMRERRRREYFRRVKVVLRTELYGRDKILAINGFALPVLTYGFGVIHWGCMDLQQLDRRTRKLLSMHGVHHSSADVDRLYAPCSDGGRGLQQIESTYRSCIVRLNCYLADSSDPFIQMIRECDSEKSSHSIERMACRFTAQLQRSLASDDKSQSLHRNASISVEGGFEQAPKQMRDITVRVAILFVCGPGVGSLCAGCIAVSLSNRL